MLHLFVRIEPVLNLKIRKTQGFGQVIYRYDLVLYPYGLSEHFREPRASGYLNKIQQIFAKTIMITQ